MRDEKKKERTGSISLPVVPDVANEPGLEKSFTPGTFSNLEVLCHSS